MTITPDTIAPHPDAPVTLGAVGTHRDASAAPPRHDAPPAPEADHLFAEGIALLDAGDHLAAAEKVWQAAVTAMVSYSDARGWQPQDWHLHRKLLDIAKLRCEELGIPYIGTPDDPDPVTSAYAAADMLEAHVQHHGNLLDMQSTRQTIEYAQPLFEIFRLD